MSSLITNGNTEAAILARVMQTSEELSSGGAEYLLSLRFGEHDVARMNELSELARQGKLTSWEEVELDGYIHVSNFLGVMQSRGRKALNCSRE